MLSDSPLLRSLTTVSNFRRVRKCTGSGTEPGLRGQWKTEIVQTVATDSLLVWEVSSGPHILTPPPDTDCTNLDSQYQISPRIVIRPQSPGTRRTTTRTVMEIRLC